MKVLVINAGSSSLKYQLIDMDDESVKAKGLCERIGIPGSKLTHKVPGIEDFVVEKTCRHIRQLSSSYSKRCLTRSTAS